LWPGGPARGSAAKNWVNLKKDSELELEDLEKEKTVSITNLYYYYRLSKPELEVWGPSPSHWQTILSSFLSPGYLQV
jgi:hypothetical protein